MGASNEILFSVPPEMRYEASLAQLGINSSMLTGDAGHA